MKQALIEQVRKGTGSKTDEDAIVWLDKNVPWWRQESTPTATVVVIDKLDDEEEER